MNNQDTEEYKDSKASLKYAEAWWANLTINQMKVLTRKYHPSGIYSVGDMSGHFVLNIWNREGHPEPQELIPVT